MFYEVFWDGASKIDGKVIFTTEHIITLIISAVAVTFITLWLKRNNNERTHKLFRYLLATILIVQDITLTIWYATSGVWDWGLTLPLELSRVSIFVTAYMLISGNKTSYELLYMLSVGGFSQALFTPNIQYQFPHVRFILYFLSHVGMVLAVVYMTAVKKYMPTVKSIVKAVVIINIYLVFVAIVNYSLPALGLTEIPGNYLFLSRRPSVPTIIDLLIKIFGEHPWYIIGLEILGIVSFIIAYLPFGIYYLVKKRSRGQENNLATNAE